MSEQPADTIVLDSGFMSQGERAVRVVRFGRRLLAVSLAALALLVAVPVVAFIWLWWEGDDLIPYHDQPPPVG
jgi:lipopolysaccharide/colanic/teichoic acid biosynthesis glycosyltransferase